MEKQETPEEFQGRMRRLSREAEEEVSRMTPEERAEFRDVARSHAEKVRDQITASYAADVRAVRVKPIEEEDTPEKSPDSTITIQSE